MRTALYLRVSDGDKQTTENQLRTLMGWADALQADVVRAYEDHETGSSATRAGLQRLLTAAHRREFDQVLIVALDRLSREGIGPMCQYVERFSTAGVRLRSYSEPWLDTDAPTTPLLIALFAWVAQQERERIRQRTKAGMARAAANGKSFGRKPVLLEIGKLAAFLKATPSITQAAKAFKVSRATIRKNIARAPRGLIPEQLTGAPGAR